MRVRYVMYECMLCFCMCVTRDVYVSYVCDICMFNNAVIYVVYVRSVMCEFLYVCMIVFWNVGGARVYVCWVMICCALFGYVMYVCM